MNVAFDAWIPAIVCTTGEKRLASLIEILTKGEQYADLSVRPHERVSLMRLFLCVAHAALNGPKNYSEWCDVQKTLPDSAMSYLNKWKNSFELFDSEKPWLQMVGLSKCANGNDSLGDTKDWPPVSKLNFSYATGNNTTLFDHEGMSDKRDISLAETLLSMITFQCFSPGGLIGTNRIKLYQNHQNKVGHAV